MGIDITQAFLSLKNYCEQEQFKGWDPYDGLNSKLFQATPLRHWDLARLAWIQGFKRSPINFRKILRVPKGYNAKGIALFLSGYCNLYELAQNGNVQFGSEKAILNQIHELGDLLLSLKTPHYSGACWGYNFDWQARRLFLFPAHTPTVVVTTFCASALFAAYEVTKKEAYLKDALSACEFIMKDLHRTPYKSGIILSYSPRKGNDTVFNASLLGAKTLSLGYAFSGNKVYSALAKSVVKAAVDAQNPDGSWVYGLLPIQNWIDSFHTGYNLDALMFYQKFTGDTKYKANIDKGFDFYIHNFFEKQGIPKYYHDQTYPIDIHCPGQLFVTLNVLGKFEVHQNLAESVSKWTIDHMQDKSGYFYYQLKRGVSSKIPYMRWSNAFMFNALSCFLKESNSFSKKSILEINNP
ncbi:delta-aminolevulinic acid dehydratase [Echinicola sp. CAU 1574]|uniref:Delta-aminolevulinic acid dehydratase n=1 Tax=Echinicola arenosa TaxID=2774144 RepID=A0ABR9AP18_9BACT|nr:delta-aminolevulinic acid dehydratase [Echinicola arenosa]MBD8490056.1 delta-aminolevulinic acid dehydratase [Echinicola arenosa]